MKAKNLKTKQYTIRNVAPSVDRALRHKAAENDESLNTVLLKALSREAGLAEEVRRYDDLDSLIGSWISDPQTEKALREQRKIYPKDWD